MIDLSNWNVRSTWASDSILLTKRNSFINGLSLLLSHSPSRSNPKSSLWTSPSSGTIWKTPRVYQQSHLYNSQGGTGKKGHLCLVPGQRCEEVKAEVFSIASPSQGARRSQNRAHCFKKNQSSLDCLDELPGVSNYWAPPGFSVNYTQEWWIQDRPSCWSGWNPRVWSPQTASREGGGGEKLQPSFDFQFKTIRGLFLLASGRLYTVEWSQGHDVLYLAAFSLSGRKIMVRNGVWIISLNPNVWVCDSRCTVKETFGSFFYLWLYFHLDV